MSDEQSPHKYSPIVGALKKLYRHQLGELSWIESPPKTMERKSRDRAKFIASGPDRAARATQIRENLPHIAYVLQLYDPNWQPQFAKPIRPHAQRAATPKPKPGWALAAVEVLRVNEEPLTVAEIVEAICDRYDIENATVRDRQRCHTAVNQALMTRLRAGVAIKHAGKPTRWSLNQPPWP